MITQQTQITITADTRAFADAMERIAAVVRSTAAEIERNLAAAAALAEAPDPSAARQSRMHTAYRARTRRRNHR